MSNESMVMKARTETSDRPEKSAPSVVDFQSPGPAASSGQPRLIDEYPDQWIAQLDSNVVAHGKYLPEVLRQVDKSGIDRTQVIVRFIERTSRSLVM